MTVAAQEPLEESAVLARRLAPELCRIDPVTGERCAWNHGFWQILRLLKLNATPEDQAQLYRDALRGLANAACPPRVLVSGSADYGMLHQVFAAFEGTGCVPEVTVVDICETPLALNRWYAERVGISITTVRDDMLTYADSDPFDVVCTHSFFGQFAPKARKRLLAQWRSLLRPGGVAVTVNRVRPDAGHAQVAFGTARAVAFCDAIVQFAESLPPALELDVATLGREAERYALCQRPYPVRSVEEIRALFERGGFEIERLDCAPVPDRQRHAVRGPTVSAGADYASVIARRV